MATPGGLAAVRNATAMTRDRRIPHRQPRRNSCAAAACRGAGSETVSPPLNRPA